MKIIGSNNFTRYLIKEGEDIYTLLHMEACRYLYVQRDLEQQIVNADAYSGLCVDCLTCIKQEGIPNSVGRISFMILDIIQQMLEAEKPVFLVRNCQVYDVRYPEPDTHKETHVFQLEYITSGEPSYIALIYADKQPTLYTFDVYPYVVGSLL